MEITFRKLAGNEHEIIVRGRRGPDVHRRARETGQIIPHDLVHAAVEKALGLTTGFWGVMERGGTFAEFEPMEPSRHRRSGLKVLRREGEAVMQAELAVGWAYRAWSGQPMQGRGVPPGRPPIDAEQLRRAAAALDEAAAAWRALEDGEALVWQW